MVEGKKKSRSFARKHVAVTKGSKIRYDKRNPGRATGKTTDQHLHGVPRGRPVDLKRMTKSQRRPQRPFGGVLTSQAMRAKFKDQARSLDL